MATTLFMRETFNSGLGLYGDALPTRGAGLVTVTVNTAASGTNIQWTKTTSGGLMEWISGRSPVGGWTLAGTMTFNIWAAESNMSANCGARARYYKRTAAGVETEIASSPADDGVELAITTREAHNWTETPTSTAFAENDRLVIKFFITNIGTMGAGFTCTMAYGGPTGAADGDSFVTLTETVAFKAEDRSNGYVLIAHCNGTDASTTFTDSSSRAQTLTAFDNAQIDTAQSVFGGASMLSDGAGGDRVTIGSNPADFVFPGDFTVHFWYRLNSHGRYHGLYSSTPFNGAFCENLTILQSGSNQVLVYTELSGALITGTSFIFSGTWHHIAVTRSGSTLRLFIDGVEDGSTTDTSIFQNGFDVTHERPTFGVDGRVNNDSLDGWIDEVIVNNNTALWTANFTPPAQEFTLASSLIFTPNAYFLPLIVR